MRGTEVIAYKQFQEGLTRAKAKPYGWHVSFLANPPDEYDVFVVANGKGGAAVHKATGELVGVWSDGGGLLKRITNAATYLGAKFLTCYGDDLTRIYEEAGWELTERHPFNPEFAPDDWPGHAYIERGEEVPKELLPDYCVLVKK